MEPLEDRVVLSAWTAIGPAPIDDGGTPSGTPVSGRITGIAADPKSADTVYIAAAGGGVWKTTNATASTPTWTPLTDNLTSGGNPVPEFMGAIAETDATSGTYNGNQIVYAGTGEANNAADSYYGDGILVSTNGGSTWTLTTGPSNAFTGTTVSKIVIDPSDTTGATAYAAVSGYAVNGTDANTGIWKTTDFGQSWTNKTGGAGLLTNVEWSDVVIDPHTPSTLFAAEGDYFGAGGNGIYESTDGGDTWKPTNAPSGSTEGRIALALYDDGTTKELLISIATPTSNPSTGGQLLEMLESTDGGNTFNRLASVPNYLGATDPLSGQNYGQGWYDTTLAIDPTNPNYLYAGGSDNGGSSGNIESFDGGTTWTGITSDKNGNGPHSDDHAVAFDANGNLLDGDDGGVFRLNNPTNFSSQTWDDLNTNLQITQFTGIAVDPTTTVAYGGSQDNGTEKYNNSTSWIAIAGGDGGITRVDPTNHNIVYQEYTGVSLDVSTDGGSTFNSIVNGIVHNTSDFYVPYMLDASGNIYYGTNELNYSSNHGTTWSQIGQPNRNGFNGSDAAIDAVAVNPVANSNVVYVSAGGFLFVTQNAQAGGSNVTWTQLNGFHLTLPNGFDGAHNNITVDPSDSTGATAYVVVNAFESGGQHVFETTNFGANWTDISGNLPNTPVWSVAVSSDGKTVYIGTDVGVYSTSNVNGSSTSWSVFGTGLPNTQVVELEDVPGQNLLAAGTHGRGMFEVSTTTGAADVSITATGPSTVTAGTDATYTITLTNNGPATAQGVVLTDTLATNANLVSITPAAGNPDSFTKSSSASSVTETAKADIASGNADVFTLVVDAPGNLTSGADFSDTASVTTTSTDNSSNDNTSTVSGTITTVADLSLTATGPATVTAGLNATYTITLTNKGPSDAQNVSLTDTVPTGTTFVSAAPVSGQNPDGFSYSQSSGTVTGTPAGGVVAAGNKDVFTLVVTALSSDADGSPISNTATVTTTTTDDSATDNDETSTVSSTVAAVADLSITKAGPATITAGTNATYTISLGNNGPSDAQGVSLTDAVPTGTTFVSAAAVANENPDGFAYTQSSGTITGTPSGGTVATGHTDVFTVVVTALASDKSGSTIGNTASVSTTTTDDSAANDETSTVTSTVAAVADLSISKTGPATITAGMGATYTVTLANNGPSDAQNVSLTDAVPTGTTFVSAAPVSGQNPDGFTYSESAGTVTGTPAAGLVAAGHTDVFALVVTALSGDRAGSPISNTATVRTTTTDDSATDNDETSTVTSTVAAVADLSITQAGPATVTAGLNATYTIALTNKGPSDARNVSLTDAVPSGTTFVSATPVSGQNPDGFTYAESAGTVTGAPAGGVVAAGHTDVFTLVVAAPSSNGDGSAISNTATVSSTTPDDSSPGDETSTVTSTVAAVADLSITKTGPATITAGMSATYTITLVNNGPSDAQNVSLTDAVPTGTTFVSAAPVSGQNPDGFAYTQSSSTITGSPSAGVVAAGNTDAFTVVVTALASDKSGSTIGNTASVSTTTTDDSAANDETSTVTSTVAAVADLSITQAGPATITAGMNATYTISLANKGPSDAQGVSLTDAVPTGTTFVSAAPVSGQNPDGFTYSDSAGTVTGTPAGGIVAAGHTDVFTLVVTALSGDRAGSAISNTASVTTTTTDDSTADDEVSTVTSAVAAVADLSITKVGPATITAGADATYTITLTNSGPSDAQNVSLTDAVPTGTTFVSATPVGGQNPDGFSYTESGGKVTGTPTGKVVAAGRSDVFIMVVHVSSGIAEDSSISNTATVTTTTTDDSATDNDETSTVSSTVAAVADLSITKTGPATITAGLNATYTIALTNKGPSDARNVSLTDAVPSGTTFVSATPVSGQNPDGFTYVQSGGTVTGTPGGGVVTAGNMDVFMLVVAAPSSDMNGSTISNTVSVSTTTTDDSAANDETSTVTSTVAAVADLSVTKAGPTAITAGTDATYTITLANNGPSDAQGVSLTDAIPTGTTFVSVASVSGQNPDGFTYSESAGIVTGSPTGGVVAAGRRDVFTMVVHAPSSDGAGSTISNTASVSMTTADDSGANDESSTVTSTVAAVADLSVTKSGPATITAGTAATYTITLSNSGPSDAQNVSLTDALPTGTSFVSATPISGQNPDGFSYAESGGTVTGTPTGGVVAAGNSDAFTVVVAALSSDTDGSTLRNTASVSTTTTDDSSPNDESSTVTSSVAAVADLSVTQTGPATVTEGSPITYTLTLTNNGPSDAQNVELTDTLPTGLTLVSASTSQGTYAASSGTVMYSPGTVGAGNNVVATLVVQPNEDGTFTATATATSTTNDPQPGNDTASVAATVIEPAINVTPVLVSGAEFSSLNNVTVATFTHANGVEPASAFSATINWGDNTTTSGNIVQTGTTYYVQGTHTYQRDGTYPITVSVVEAGEPLSVSSNPTASIAEAGLPAGTLPGPFSDFVNEIFENLYHEQLSAQQISLLAVTLFDFELSAMAALIQTGVDPSIAYEMSVFMGATEFSSLAQNLANYGTSIDSTVLGLASILFQESFQLT